MLWQHRSIVAVIMLAFTILGVGSGIRLAQIENRQQWDKIQADQLTARETTAPEVKTDRAFFAENKPPQKPAVPKKIPADEFSDGISAESYIVGNLKTGEIILSKNVDKVLPFASMSKLVAALVATNLYSSSTEITIKPEATEVPPDASGLRAGEVFTVRELLYPLLMNSSNVAGEALASSNREAFMKLMSDFSWEIGMPESHLADPTGLSTSNSGTARGFFGLARYLHRERPDILSFTRIATYSISTTTEHGAHDFTNIHPFVSDARFLGGKTGYTNAALYTMLTIMDIKGKPVAFIVLRSQDRAKDTALLIEKVLKSSI